MMIPNLDVKGIVELAAAASIFVGVFGALIIAGKRGIGPRTIQFAGAVMLVPVILILALEKVLEPAVLGTVIGAVIGYLLSGISEAFAAPGNQNSEPPRT
jgi:hypothetical protein